MQQDRLDCDGRALARRTRDFDGSKPYDSPIVFWSRRVQRRLDALTPWAQFGSVITQKLSVSHGEPNWMYTLPGRRRARYYAEDYYLLLTTAFVTLWACLTTGLTKVSYWQEPAIAWVLIIPGLLLLVLYVWASGHTHRVVVTVFWVVGLAVAVVLPTIFGLGGWIRWFVPWPLVLRAAGILLVLVRITSFDTLTGGYLHTPVSRVKYTYYVILSVVQVCFIYTAIYAFWVPSGFYDPSRCVSTATTSCALVTGLNNHIYLSVMTLTTLGSGFSPYTGLPQWLQMSEVAFGILLLAVGLAVFVGSLPLIALRENVQNGTHSDGSELRRNR
jgi:hypothetical protein